MYILKSFFKLHRVQCKSNFVNFVVFLIITYHHISRILCLQTHFQWEPLSFFSTQEAYLNFQVKISPILEFFWIIELKEKFSNSFFKLP